MDVFYLQTNEGLAFGRENNHALEILRKRTQSVIKNKTVDQINIPEAYASRRAGAIPVVPRIRFVQNSLGGSTILEIQGRDRPGLLHDIACILRDAGVEVLSAHIEVVGNIAIDSFYLCLPGTEGGLPEKIKKNLRRRLKDLLSPSKAQAA